MPTDFTLPELGENITAGDVVRVLVSPGDSVAKDQPVLELETDKATIEVPSTVAGTVKDVRVKAGERIKVGQVVLTVEDGAGGRPRSRKRLTRPRRRRLRVDRSLSHSQRRRLNPNRASPRPTSKTMGAPNRPRRSRQMP